MHPAGLPGIVGADLIRESRRYVRLSRTRSAPTTVLPGNRWQMRPTGLPGIVGADLIRESRRYVRLSRTRSAPTTVLPGNRWQMRPAGLPGIVGADLIRESRRYVRLSRTRSAPTKSLPAWPARRFVGWVSQAQSCEKHPLTQSRGDGYRFAQHHPTTVPHPVSCRRALPAIRAEGASLHGMERAARV